MLSMARDRSADIHMKDGILRRGRVLGHSDPKGRIRERDGRFRKGRELGYVDDKHRVRRPRKLGALGRGEVVARIRGNAVYGKDTVLASGRKLGYVDERGNVWQTDCQAFRGRVVGRARGADPESALAYFALKFLDVQDHVNVLEEKIRPSEDKFAFLPRVRATRQLLPEVDALGEFDLLFERLDDLEEMCVVGLGDHFLAEGGLGRVLSEGLTIDGLRKELVSILGGERRTQVDAVLYRARGAIDAISEGRIPTLADLEGPPEPPPPEYDDPVEPPPPESLESMISDGKSLRSISRSSLERLRGELAKLAADPTYPADELVDRARRTISTYLDSGEEARRSPSTLPPLPPPGRSSAPPPERSARTSVLPDPTEIAADATHQIRDYVDGVLGSEAAVQVRSAVEQRLGEVRDWQKSQGEKVLEWRDKIGRIAGRDETDAEADADE